MAQSIKLSNNNYIDGESVEHTISSLSYRKNLKDILAAFYPGNGTIENCNSIIDNSISGYTAGTLNKPAISGFAEYGMLITFNLGELGWVHQLALGNYNSLRIAHRCSVDNGSNWTNWELQ